MKKGICFALFFLSCGIIFANSFAGWFEHCNFSFGGNYATNLNVDVGAKKQSFYIQDGFGDMYRFQYDSKEATKSKLPLIFDMRFPFYFDRYNAMGCDLAINGLYSGIGQLHMDLYYAYNISKKIQISLFGGWTAGYMNSSLGELQSAFIGDPGYYTKDGKFIKPGTNMTLSGIGVNGFNIGTSIKYRPFKYDKLFFQLGYRYTPDIIIDDFSLNLGDTKFKSDDIDFEKIKIESSNHIFLTFGWGI